MAPANIGWGSFRAVAQELRMARNTVRQWGRRFRDARLDGMADRPRSGRPPVFSGAARAQIVGLACRAPRDEGCSDADRWTLDLLVETALAQGIVPAIHRASIARLLAQGDLKPHRGRMWLHSQDPAFKERINEIVALYLQHQVSVVLCIDEKTGLQALERRFADRPRLRDTPAEENSSTAATAPSRSSPPRRWLPAGFTGGVARSSLQDLEQRIHEFIARYNTRAGPFKWTWKGYPLVA